MNILKGRIKLQYSPLCLREVDEELPIAPRPGPSPLGDTTWTCGGSVTRGGHHIEYILRIANTAI